MLRALGRIICTRQEERMIAIFVSEVKFNILTDVRFAGVRVAADQAAHQSAAVGKVICFNCL
jgi:hypothetical protein